MQPLLSVWSELDTRRRVVAGLAGVLTLLAVLGLSRMAATPRMELLYAGLEPSSAGEVVQALDQRGVAYEVRSGSIFVPAGARDRLRLTLAAEGLPANSAQGYELLDTLSGFGTTAQMFDAAYWRAKEGELARTIVASPDIKSARVHIANPASTPFQRELKPTASVTVTASGGALGGDRARALRYLVASAVAGLAPDDVSVIDSRGGLIGGEERPTGGSDDRAAEMKANIERLLEARVGPGKAVVELSVETVTESEAITERRFDPDSRVAISTDTEERSTSSTDSRPGGVTVASNLPDGDAAGGDGQSASENSETRERINFEVSETRREVVRAPGAIRRLSVAVLVDGIRATDPVNGAESWAPRPEEELAALRELVASAVGLDEARGDTLTLQSMEFRPIEAPGTPPGEGWPMLAALDPMALVQIGVLALVSLALGLFVVRPILVGRPRRATVEALAPPAAVAVAEPGIAPAGAAAQLPATLDQVAAVSGEAPGIGAIGPAGGATAGGGRAGAEAAARAGVEAADADDAPPPDPVERLRRLIEERQSETVEILRSWMEDRETT